MNIIGPALLGACATMFFFFGDFFMLKIAIGAILFLGFLDSLFEYLIQRAKINRRKK